MLTRKCDGASGFVRDHCSKGSDLQQATTNGLQPTLLTTGSITSLTRHLVAVCLSPCIAAVHCQCSTRILHAIPRALQRAQACLGTTERPLAVTRFHDCASSKLSLKSDDLKRPVTDLITGIHLASTEITAPHADLFSSQLNRSTQLSPQERAEGTHSGELISVKTLYVGLLGLAESCFMLMQETYSRAEVKASVECACATLLDLIQHGTILSCILSGAPVKSPAWLCPAVQRLCADS